MRRCMHERWEDAGCQVDVRALGLLVGCCLAFFCLTGQQLAPGCALRVSLGVCPIQSPSAGGTLSGISTRSRGAMPSAKPRARYRGWSVGARAQVGAAA